MKQKTFGLRVAGVLLLCFVQHAVGAQEFIREALWHKDAIAIRMFMVTSMLGRP